MSYAFHTPDKLSFILDLMNGGDLHYHLSQHGVFSEADMRFYAAEIILGLEHMHNRFVVYRDLKVRCRPALLLPWLRHCMSRPALLPAWLLPSSCPALFLAWLLPSAPPTTPPTQGPVSGHPYL